MARTTIFQVQPYVKTIHGITLGEARAASSKQAAIRCAQNMLDGRIVGAVAFAKSGDPSTGDWDEEPEFLGTFGELPEWV